MYCTVCEGLDNYGSLNSYTHLKAEKPYGWPEDWMTKPGLPNPHCLPEGWMTMARSTPWVTGGAGWLWLYEGLDGFSYLGDGRLWIPEGLDGYGSWGPGLLWLPEELNCCGYMRGWMAMTTWGIGWLNGNLRAWLAVASWKGWISKVTWGAGRHWSPEGLGCYGYFRGWMAMATCGAGWSWPLRAMDGWL